ncbi:TAP-like protein-domain-containing protein [Mycena capillaripes]|nr:TAP-like protein-domain-containing protein [Mycena capillaripes]
MNRLSVFAGWVALAALVGFVLFAQSNPRDTTDWANELEAFDAKFSWANVVASEELTWVDCYTAHQCARLNVPLNYSEPDGAKAAIAITRYPAAVAADSPLYRGPVLFNPGGPGGSGVSLIAAAGSLFSTIIGPEYDIIGFDPRGVAYSTPRVSRFATDAEEALWAATEVGDLDASADAVARMWARSQVGGRLAAERAGDLLPHINTDNTARDMLRIVEAHGQEKLQFWGMSYGSVLGSVFAAMFPDKVERIIIDGVVDTEDYFQTLWANNLVDADNVLQSFFDGCADAGPEGCAFYAPTPEAIAQNLTTLYESIRARPISVRTSSGYGLADFNMLRGYILLAMYTPQVMFVPLANVLADLARGDGSLLLENLLAVMSPFECSCGDGESQAPYIDMEALLAIRCNDGRAVPSGFEEAEQHYKNMTKSSSFGGLWAHLRNMCSGWPDIPKQHFQGPVTGNTSVPLLIIGNTGDPVTSLWAAKKMSKAFPGSVVLTQDCGGHASLAAPSPCTWAHVREYFRSGTLPDPDTVCPVLGSPFPEGLQKREQVVFSVEEHNMLETFKTVQRDWSKRFVPRL